MAEVLLLLNKLIIDTQNGVLQNETTENNQQLIQKTIAKKKHSFCVSFLLMDAGWCTNERLLHPDNLLYVQNRILSTFKKKKDIILLLYSTDNDTIFCLVFQKKKTCR